MDKVNFLFFIHIFKRWAILVIYTTIPTNVRNCHFLFIKLDDIPFDRRELDGLNIELRGTSPSDAITRASAE